MRNHANFILKHLEINDSVKRILEKDLTTIEGRNLKLDFRAELTSGRILDIEGESDVLRDKQLKKSLGYLKENYSQEGKQTITIIIALAEGNHKRIYDKEPCIDFKPYIIEIKKYNGEQYLNIFKNKVQDKEIFSDNDCAIFEMLPEMKFNRDMNDVIDEAAHVLKDAIIPTDNKNSLITIMNLSIDYYVDDEDQRDELRGLLKMDEAFDSEFDRMMDESEQNGIKQGMVEGIALGRKEGIAVGRKEGIVEGRKEGIVEGKIEGIIEGKIEGRKEGIEEGELRILRYLMENNNGDISVEKIAEKFNHPISDVLNSK